MDTDKKRKIRLWLDAAERVIVTALFVWLSYRVIGNVSQSPFTLLFLLAEGAVAIFVLLRRSTEQISVRPMDWIVGFIGTTLPMLIMPNGGGHSVGIVLLMAGLLIALGAKFSLRRSFGIVAANRGIKRTGLYAAVRHPMYLGYFLSNTGVLILNPSWFNAAILSLWALCQAARIQAEERILMQDPVYRDHADKVRFKLLPLVY